MPTTTLRDLALVSFKAALRRANEGRDRRLVLNAASFAGYALAMAGDDVQRAHSFVPGDREGFSADIHTTLDAIEVESELVEGAAQ